MRGIFPIAAFSALVLGCSFVDHDSCQHETPFEISGSDDVDVETEACPTDSLCLEVMEIGVGAIDEGRIAVVWYPLQASAQGVEPEIALDMVYEPKNGHVAIPFEAIAAPRNKDLFLCERSCDVGAACPCTGDATVATATLVIARDQNRDQRLSRDEID